MSLPDTRQNESVARKMCNFCQTKVPRDNRGPDGEVLKTPCGEPLCLKCWLDINGMGEIDTDRL